jgi:hypothetical protein
MNKTIAKIASAMLCVCAALLFHACESSFLKGAMEALNPSPSVFAGMQWSSENEIYINPKDFSISGTMSAISGVFVNGGKQIWPIQDMKDHGGLNGKRAWRIESSDKVNYPAGSITSILAPGSPFVGGSVGIKGDSITLAFEAGSAVMDTFVNAAPSDEPFPAGGVTFSFILTPNAFFGADVTLLATDTLTRNFKLVVPTSTVYGKLWLERHMYGTISSSWGKAATDIGDSGLAGTEAQMKENAGSLAVNDVTAWLDGYAATVDPGLTFEFDNSDPDKLGSLAVNSWNPAPDLSQGWAPLKNYSLVLTPIRDSAETEQPFAPVTISVPIEFTSNVGSVVTAVKDAIEAGTFGQEPNPDSPYDPGPGDTGYPYYIQHLGDIEDADGTVSGSVAVDAMITGINFQGLVQTISTLPLANSTGQQQLTITFGPGADGSPANKLTFTVWVNAAQP